MDIAKSVTGKTKVIALIGNPIEHSISPQLHNTISKYLGKDLIYVPLRVEHDELEIAVRGLKAINIEGFNVTIPYKQDIIKYIDEVSWEARLIGAVNTVKISGGKLYGYNTDMYGFIRSFNEETGTGIRGRRVLVIGAGGAARSIAIGAAAHGADKIYIANRTKDKAVDLVNIINSHFGELACIYEAEEADKAYSCLDEFDVVINATSLGMYPEIQASPVSEKAVFDPNSIAYDAIYNPPKTRFLTQAERHGCIIINGLGMVLHQGIKAYEIWTGLVLPESVRKEIFESFKNYIYTCL